MQLDTLRQRGIHAGKYSIEGEREERCSLEMEEKELDVEKNSKLSRNTDVWKERANEQQGLRV